MEDAATVEISRSQIWQWIHHPNGFLEDGRKVTVELFQELMQDELAKIQAAIGEKQFAARKFQTASEILDKIITADQFVDFLTLPAYQYLN